VETTLARIGQATENDLVGSLVCAGVAVEAEAAQRARDLGDAAAEASARDRLRGLLERARAVAAEGGPVERAQLATAEGDAARGNGAPDAAPYRAAAEAWDAIERPYPAAQARWREAEAHLALDDRDAAGAAARAALETARRLGSEWLTAEVEQLASRGRLRVDAPAAPEPPAAPDDPFELTPRERQVLALVARGATNREIGRDLFMSEKTASVHVSRILAKLDVRSRTQAAAVAHRLGLAEEITTS
jgi:DNA-binding CsgD family transcriptional regulator